MGTPPLGRVQGFTRQDIRRPRDERDQQPPTPIAVAFQQAGGNPPPPAVEPSAPAPKQVTISYRKDDVNGTVIKKGGFTPPVEVKRRKGYMGMIDALKAGEYFDTDEPLEKLKSAVTGLRVAAKKQDAKQPDFWIGQYELTDEEKQRGDDQKSWRVYRKA